MFTTSNRLTLSSVLNMVCQEDILLRKIALPYPHKCLFGFVEQNTSTDKNFKEIFLSQEVTPLSAHVRACTVVVMDRRLSRALHYIFGRYGSNTYFFLIIANFRCKSMEF